MSLVLRFYAWLITCVESDMGAFVIVPMLKVPWVRWWMVGWRLWYVCIFDMGGFLFEVMGIVLHGWERVAFLRFRCVFSFLMSSVLRFYARVITCDESDKDASACELGLKVPWMSWRMVCRASGTGASSACRAPWSGSEWRVGLPPEAPALLCWWPWMGMMAVHSRC